MLLSRGLVGQQRHSRGALGTICHIPRHTTPPPPTHYDKTVAVPPTNNNNNSALCVCMAVLFIGTFIFTKLLSPGLNLNSRFPCRADYPWHALVLLTCSDQ